MLGKTLHFLPLGKPPLGNIAALGFCSRLTQTNCRDYLWVIFWLVDDALQKIMSLKNVTIEM